MVEYRDLQKWTFETMVHPPEGYILGERVCLSMLMLITINVIIGIIETVPELHELYHEQFYWFEFTSVMIFTLECVLRLWSCTVKEQFSHWFLGRIKALTRPLTIVDILAISPFYVTFFVSPYLMIDLRFVRVLRLFRLFRIFRFGEFSRAFVLINDVVTMKKEELILSFMLLVLVLILSSSIMFILEQDAPGTKYTSIPASMWWGMMTITTIGYGDVYPETAGGKIFGCFVAAVGICTFALPVGILGSGFSVLAEKKNDLMNHQKKHLNQENKMDSFITSSINSSQEAPDVVCVTVREDLSRRRFCPTCGKEE